MSHVCASRVGACVCAHVQAPEKAAKAIEQFTGFAMGHSPWEPAVLAKAKTLPAYKFWAAEGSSVPELQKVAIITLASVTGAGEAERCWKKLDWIHNKRRNRLKPERARKLVRLNTALALKRKALATAGEEEYWGWDNNNSSGSESE
jgi:hypothetical protein